jgi:exopolysaccharide biosynthesis polyprenyl glycosylphosphotransferase
MLLPVLDFVALFSVFLGVFALWFTFLRGHPEEVIGLLPLYLASGAAFAGIWILFTHLLGGYNHGLLGTGTIMLTFRGLIYGGVHSTVALAVLSFLLRGTMLSRGTIFVSFLVGAVALSALRLWFANLDRRFSARGLVSHRVVALGLDSAAREFGIRLRSLRSTVRLLGFLDSADTPTRLTLLGLPVLGGRRDYAAFEEGHPFDALIVSAEIWGNPTCFGRNERVALLNFCESRDIALYLISSVHDVAVISQEVGTLSEMPLFRIGDSTLRTGYRVVKRAIDIVVSVILIVSGLPVWLAIMVLLKLSSRGPIFFKQVRIGLHGREFAMLKFRSMVPDAEQRCEALVKLHDLPEPVFKIPDDPRVTGIGRFLRRTGLDEVPQLLHVLAGRMSLVGPRPEEASVVALYDEQQRRRLKAKPGITGLQQVECRGCSSLKRRVNWDLAYMKHQSLLLDAYILIRTIGVVLRGRETT